jgi:hypothetical protein
MPEPASTDSSSAVRSLLGSEPVLVMVKVVGAGTNAPDTVTVSVPFETRCSTGTPDRSRPRILATAEGLILTFD